MAGDEQIRAQVMPSRQIQELTDAESWQLLRSVSLGRIVFTWHAMPAIRPVNHLVEDEAIIIRSHLGSAIVARTTADDGAVVCYEADELDPVTVPSQVRMIISLLPQYQREWDGQ